MSAPAPFRNSRVKSIAPAAPFLPTLVEALLSGNLVPGFAPGNDPLALSDATIWVPTRRAARELATELVQRLEGEVALLPTIKTLGDVDDDALFFEGHLDVADDLEETVSPLERQLKLASLIEAWASNLNETQRELFAGAEILMPSSIADAVWFAQDLARLMDTVATEEADWSQLHELVPDDHAEWWKLTLEFLKIATEFWPAYLQENHKQEATVLRATRLRKQTELYAQSDHRGPVIAAGSTGSIPATAALLKTIARLENGVVVLPGLDRTMDDEVWAKIDLPDNDRDDHGSAPGHPQFGLKLLLNALGIDRGDVEHIGGIDNTGTGFDRIREQLVANALLPSNFTDLWQELSYGQAELTGAFSNISLIEAPGEREEALAIALALRAQLVSNTGTAALVTPDRNLARRVAVELRRFGLSVDDSAGQPLRNRPQGTLVRLVLQVAFGDDDNTVLVSLLKHPLVRFGLSEKEALRLAQTFELVLLRGAITPLEPGNYLSSAKSAREALERSQYVHSTVRQLEEQDWEDLNRFCAILDEIFSSPPSQSTFCELVERTVYLTEALCVDEDHNLVHLYDGEEGQALSGLFAELLDQKNPIDLEPSQWPDVFDALMGSRAVRPHVGTHPRLSILGPLEARLQTFDRIVLGGLNEKTWPASARNDPFLSRPMKAQLKLPPPERRTGLAAHDFQMMLGMGDVIITRATRVDNAPTIASRWLQRVLMVAGDQASAEMRKKGSVFLDWASQIDQPKQDPTPAAQPSPEPPVEMRPRTLSITDIETWIKDPYAIYAKRILKLAPLEPITREADVRERGSLYHNILEEFIAKHHDLKGDDAKETLGQIADNHFKSSGLADEMLAIWRPRFQTILENFLEWHDERHSSVSKFLVEIEAKLELPEYNFTLRGRADRVDVMADGTVSLLDYKTGTTPTLADMKQLKAPQLPLEAAMVEQGAFVGIPSYVPSELAYIRLRNSDELGVDTTASGKNPIDVSDLGHQALDRLKGMVTAYDNPKKSYVSKARLMKDNDRQGDYDHLARVREWTLAEDSGDEQ